MQETLQDPVLGHLTFCDLNDWWESEGDFEFKPGQDAYLCIFYNPDEDVLEDVLAQARRNLERTREKEHDYRQWTAKQLVTRPQGEKVVPMTADEFAERLRVGNIYFFQEGSWRVEWADQGPSFSGGSSQPMTKLSPEGECVEARWV
jgi:hypothetical protein